MERGHHLPLRREGHLQILIPGVQLEQGLLALTLFVPQAALRRGHFHRGLRHVAERLPSARVGFALELGGETIQVANRQVGLRHERVDVQRVRGALRRAQIRETGLREDLASLLEFPPHVHPLLRFLRELPSSEQAAVGAEAAQRIEVQPRLRGLLGILGCAAQSDKRLRGHLALGQGARLVCANDAGGTQIIHRSPAGDHAVAQQHLPGAHPQHDHHDEWQSMRNDGHGHDEPSRSR
mmetsp:Transcript_92509/g.299058  ORF Transcript_92509/g.299058 Transcript_92509/m.299058 type:complete len:238 (+) Transcript_92509:2231-2944(+)